MENSVKARELWKAMKAEAWAIAAKHKGLERQVDVEALIDGNMVRLLTKALDERDKGS